MLTVVVVKNLKPKIRHNFKKSFLLYFILPAIYALAGYFIIALIISPLIKPLYSGLSLLIHDKASLHQRDVIDIYNSKISENLEIVSIENITYPKYETVYGEIIIQSVGIKAPVIYGDSDKALKKGFGQNIASELPGFGQTILLGAHNNTFAKGIGEVSMGDEITIKTSYGKYTYSVSDIRKINVADANKLPLGKAPEKLILYTCYPFNALASTKIRYCVFADLKSGPKIIEK